jgi:hypothetical protein
MIISKGLSTYFSIITGLSTFWTISLGIAYLCKLGLICLSGSGFSVTLTFSGPTRVFETILLDCGCGWKAGYWCCGALIVVFVSMNGLLGF